LTASDLAEIGHPVHIVNAVQLLTNREPSYPAFIDKLVASRNRLAMRVKLADLLDNLDPARLAALPADLAARLRSKYEGALARIALELGVSIEAARGQLRVEGDRTGEFFYLDENGLKQDADLHYAILGHPEAEDDTTP